ncbi:putative 3beta-hydroxysteroid-4alpha-carboxylate 3-dehydrogenase [Microsporum audouinii]
MDPVLVIGGCGGLGHTIVRQLLEKGDASDVTVFDIETKRNIVEGAKYFKGSIGCKEDVQRALERVKPRTIFHSASPLLMQQKNTQRLYEKINIEGNRYLLDAIQGVQTVRALVYTSSSSVVHDGFSDIVEATEDLPRVFYPEQPEFYSHTKAIAEEMVVAANRTNGLLTVVLRGTTLFGEGDSLTIPRMVSGAKSGRNKIRVGDGKNLFDFTYLGNCAYAHILAAKALVSIDPAAPLPPADKRIDGEVFVVTNDEHIPFWDFVYAVGDAAGYPTKREDIWQVPSALFFAVLVIAEWAVWAVSLGTRESSLNRKMVRYLSMTRTFNISKIKTRLGYRPLVGQQDAIKRTVAAYMQEQSSNNANN